MLKSIVGAKTRLSGPILSGIMIFAATLAQAENRYFESGNWASVKIGRSCHVFSLYSAPNTSGFLKFVFDEGGYDATFDYIYLPWSQNEVEPPWDMEQDGVSLYVDNQPVWMGEEMFFFNGEGFTYGATMTSSIVPEVVSSMLAAQNGFGFGVDRAAEGEVWLYGDFSTAGFGQVMDTAGSQCSFNPRALPAS
ncbi:MAG: hypothetical protein BM562_03325 [Alphaproteobacteria bacterium MedPE-SWcel]|nr:MAG: hypothetical protein BM562_03325 [Alphaproteobacteria bacterium MedPE-SWcel]